MRFKVNIKREEENKNHKKGALKLNGFFPGGGGELFVFGGGVNILYAVTDVLQQVGRVVFQYLFT